MLKYNSYRKLCINCNAFSLGQDKYVDLAAKIGSLLLSHEYTQEGFTTKHVQGNDVDYDYNMRFETVKKVYLIQAIALFHKAEQLFEDRYVSFNIKPYQFEIIIL